MIDLTKSQVLDEPVLAWVRDYEDREWAPIALVEIDYNMDYPFKTYFSAYRFCTLTNPNKPKPKRIRPMTSLEMMGKVAHGGVVLRTKSAMDYIFISFSSYMVAEEYQWATITPDGILGEWQECVVEEEVDDA